MLFSSYRNTFFSFLSNHLPALGIYMFMTDFNNKTDFSNKLAAEGI